MRKILSFLSICLFIIIIDTSVAWQMGKLAKFPPCSAQRSRASLLMSDAQSLPMHKKAARIVTSSMLSILLSSDVAHAGFFQSAEQSQINEINSYQKTVNELYDQLRPMMQPNPIGVYMNMQVLKGGKEDSDVVQRYLDNYLKPMQVVMEGNTKKVALADEASQSKLQTLPLLMKGHLLELQQAIDAQSATEQLKEVEEVQETLADYLKLVSSQFEVTPYIPSRVLSDKELFGPLGCEFWGKVRVEGSNRCIEK